jgi:hypothetical protein
MDQPRFAQLHHFGPLGSESGIVGRDNRVPSQGFGDFSTVFNPAWYH